MCHGPVRCRMVNRVRFSHQHRQKQKCHRPCYCRDIGFCSNRLWGLWRSYGDHQAKGIEVILAVFLGFEFGVIIFIAESLWRRLADPNSGRGTPAKDNLKWNHTYNNEFYHFTPSAHSDRYVLYIGHSKARMGMNSAYWFQLWTKSWICQDRLA